MIAMASEGPKAKWLVIPSLLVMYLMIVTLPAFYFALSRNEGTVRMETSFRPLAFTAILCLGLFVVAGLPGFVRALGVDWAAIHVPAWTRGATGVRSIARDPRTLDGISGVLGELSNLTTILLLIAFFRQASDEPREEVSISKPLAFTTKAAVIGWGLWAAFHALRLILSPFIYWYFVNLAGKLGRAAPPFGRLLAEIVPTALSGAGLLIAPFIVYRSQRRRREESATAAPLASDG